MQVSIVIPVYNAQNFLEKAVRSVLNQTYKNIELILVNDGSIDGSRSYCDAFARDDQRIKVVYQENKGPAAARNTGIRHATGDFLFFLDADDFIELRAIEKLISCYHQFQPELVMGNFRKLENNGAIINQGVSFSPDNLQFGGQLKELARVDIRNYVRHFFKHPSNHLVSYCWARLYNLSIVKKEKISANEDMRLFEDFAFNLDYLKHTNKLLFVNDPIYTYTMHNSHKSASMTIVDANSLLHDMGIFREKAKGFFVQTQAEAESGFDIEQEIGHTIIHYVIIFLIRSCRFLNSGNRNRIYNEIKQIIDSPIYKESLPNYSPLKGNSRVLPLLTKLKLLRLIMIYCKYKAYRRYGKPLENIRLK